MRTLLGIPFRDDGHREQAKRKTIEVLQSYELFTDLLIQDSSSPLFNRSETRNKIARYAHENDYQIVVICDADSIPEYQPLKDAIDDAFIDGRLHIPFDTVRVIPQNPKILEGNRYRRRRALYTYGPSCGGVFVIQPPRWIYAGGMDERIQGWGYEDQIFLVAAQTFLAGPVYHPGILYNFQHPRATNTAYAEQNTDLVNLYHQNTGNQEKIREISVGSNDFCAH